MANINSVEIRKIREFPEAIFEVTVSNGNQTVHTVKLSEHYYQKLTNGDMTAEELIKRSFDFLLQREPKESILRTFELQVISRYFPEYEEQIKTV